MLGDGAASREDGPPLHILRAIRPMAMLTPTDVYATVRALLLGNDREASLESVAVPAVELDWTGFAGESHGGLTRPACSRVARQHPRGVEIRNVRQVTAVSVEELEEIRLAMGAPELRPGWLGANLVVEGVPDFSALPPSSRLIGPDGAALVVDMENAPCRQPAELIETRLSGFGHLFPKAAVGRRGTTLWVERPGRLAVGDRLRLHVPPPVRWRAPADARGVLRQP